MNILFFDIETTGFSKEHNSIIELAGIVVDSETQETVDTFHEYIKPRDRITSQITQLTGITEAQVKNCPEIWEILPQWYLWLRENEVELAIGHNCDVFDKKFLDTKAKTYNIKNYFDVPTFDTLKYARQLSKEGKIVTVNCRQPTLAEFFNIEYKAHNALQDALALKQIYFKMLEL